MAIGKLVRIAPKVTKAKLANRRIKKLGDYVKPSTVLMTTVKMPKNGQFFPQVFRTRAKTVFSETISAVADYKSTIKGNSFYLMGPQTNYTGAFLTNVPSGLVYLLSSAIVAGSSAPYGRYRITSSSITLQIATNTVANSIPTYLYVWPSTKASFAGMNTNTIGEQPYVKKFVIPPNLTKPFTVRHSMSSTKINGDAPVQITSDEYSGTALADPNNLWYWQYAIHTADGTSQTLMYIEVTIKDHVEFYDLNQFTTAVPA